MNASAANIALIETVALHLGALRSRVVFLGGATVALLITDSSTPYIRPTGDVDVINRNCFLRRIHAHVAE